MSARKQIAPQGGVALIRCDGGGAYGFGHVKRMIVLARALRDREGIGAVFAVNGSEEALAPIRQAGFEAKLLAGRRPPGPRSLRSPIFAFSTAATGLRARRWRSTPPACRYAVIDDASERRLAADFAYYPPVPQAEALDWHGSACTVRIGWEWALLGTAANGDPSARLLAAADLAGDDGRQRSYGHDACARRARSARSIRCSAPAS